MKIQSIATLAVVGMLALSCTAQAAAANDEMGANSNGQSMQPPSTSNSAVPNQSNDLLNNMPQNESMNNNNASNEISPDTATGDDDY